MANFLYTIKHNKKEIPLSISFNTLQQFTKKTNANWNEIDENLEFLPVLFSIAVKNGFIKLKKENPYTDEQLVDLLDDLFFDFLALLKNEFADDVQKKIAPQA